MKGKAGKLIIGIILLIVAVVLGLLKVVNSWLCLAVGVIGLIFVILSFGGKEENLPMVSSGSEKEKEPAEPVEIEDNK